MTISLRNLALLALAFHSAVALSACVDEEPLDEDVELAADDVDLSPSSATSHAPTPTIPPDAQTTASLRNPKVALESRDYAGPTGVATGVIRQGEPDAPVGCSSHAHPTTSAPTERSEHAGVACAAGLAEMAPLR